ncbi:MAG: hypothetical protein IPJ88_08360 [Myxococcales bacterium]|nr:MAG: hypothetical protein IPJ88_08360 [Myxococcales bacterium]
MDAHTASLDEQGIRTVLGIGGFSIEIVGSETLPATLTGASERFRLPGFSGSVDLH